MKIGRFATKSLLSIIGALLLVGAGPSRALAQDDHSHMISAAHHEPTAEQKTVDADAMQRSIDLMQQRVNQFGVSEAEINQAGKDQIEVGLPEKPEKSYLGWLVRPHR